MDFLSSEVVGIFNFTFKTYLFSQLFDLKTKNEKKFFIFFITFFFFLKIKNSFKILLIYV